MVSWLSRAWPFPSLWDLLCSLPQNIHKLFWSDGKRPSHETRLVVPARFWSDLSFLSTTQDWNQSLSSSVPNPKTKSLGSWSLRKGQGRMSAVWVAWFSAHFAGLSGVPSMARDGEFQSPTFSSSSFFYLHQTSLPAGSPHAQQRICMFHSWTVANMSQEQLRPVTSRTELTEWPGWGAVATCIQTSTNLEGCLTLVWHKSSFSSSVRYFLSANLPFGSQHIITCVILRLSFRKVKSRSPSKTLNKCLTSDS